MYAQVAYLQAQLVQAKSQLANTLVDNRSIENQWTTTTTTTTNGNYPGIIQTAGFQTQSCPTTTTTTNRNNNNNNNYINNNNPISPQSSLDSIDQQNVSHDHHGMMVMAMQDYGGVIQAKSEGIIGKKRTHNDMGELQELALRMMRN